VSFFSAVAARFLGADLAFFMGLSFFVSPTAASVFTFDGLSLVFAAAPFAVVFFGLYLSSFCRQN